MLAALDIGTNSFHLVVARRRGPDGFEVITRERDVVRLGHGGGDMKEIDPDAMERGIASLRRMQRIAASHRAHLTAVATSAVREAHNARTFLQRAHDEAHVDVEVISGLEEARLIHLGVLQALRVFDERLLLVDIGGGSTEVLIGEQGETIAARSFKLGAVRLTDRFFPGGRVSSSAVRSCRDYVRSILATFEREVRETGYTVAVASSGTAESIARLVHAQRGGAEPRTFNSFRFDTTELDDVVAKLLAAKTADARRSLPGMEPARADIIVGGALVLEALAHAYGVKAFMFSEGALREGVLVDSLSRLTGGTVHHLREVSRRSIRQLADRCDDDPRHSARVAALAVRLFDQLRDALAVDETTREYLEAGALLANVGLVIAHSKHHLHSYYVIRNSELAGLTDAEIEIISQVARYHRKSGPKPAHPEFAQLSAADQHVVRALAAVLRVAIGLDRSHDGRVTDVHAQVRPNEVVISLDPAPGADVALEVYAASERRQLLEAVLGRPVRVTASGRRA